MAMKFSRLGLIVLLGVMGSVFTPLTFESSLFSVTSVVAQTSQERKEEADRLNKQGIEQYNTSQLQAALQSLQAALEIYQEIEDKEGIAKSLNNLGLVYDDLGQYEKAINYYQQSLAIYREIEDKKGMAAPLNNLGVVYENLRQYEQAINYYQQSLAIEQEIGNKEGIAASIYNLGIVYYYSGQYEKALDYYQQSLAIYREIENQQPIADSLNNLGLVYRSFRQYEKALDYLKQSLDIYQEIENKIGTANSLHNIGNVYADLKQYEKAIDYNQRALEIYQEIDNKEGTAKSLNNLGLGYYDLGQYEKAEDYHRRSLAIQLDTEDKKGIAMSFNNLGLVYEKLGHYEKAIDYYQQGLAIDQEIDNQEGMAISFNNLGEVYDELEQYEKAIDYYQQGLAIHRERRNQKEIAATLNNLGEVHHKLGQYEKALDYLKQSLEIDHERDNQAGIAIGFNNLGNIYFSLGQYRQAINYHQQSLEIDHERNNQAGIADSLNNQGNVYYVLGQYEKAKDYYQQSLDIKEEIDNQLGMATSHNNLGAIYNSLGQNEKAIDEYNKSLAISREIEHKRGMATSLNNLGYTLFKSGNLTAAENNLIEAMEVLESLRVGLSDEQKISIFDTQIGTYAGLQLTFTSQNKTNQALEISERGRARALVELLVKRFSSSSQEEQKPPEYPQIAEIKQIATQQNTTLVQYSVVDKNIIYIWVISPQGKIDFVRENIPQDTTLKELVEQGKACATDVNSKEKCRSNEIPDTFVPGDLVRFNNDKESRLERPWRVTAFNPETGMLTVTHPQFNDTNITVERHKSEVIPLGNNLEVQLKNLQKLHKLLIAPIKQFLPEDENDHVIFIPHQELFGVPFPALQDEQGTYLIKQHTILTAPSIQALQLTNQRRNALGNKDLSQSEFLIVGNPDMPNNPELPGENLKLTPLPHSETEANNIASQFNSQALIGLVATETTVVEKMKTADIIHLATHGLVQDNYTGGSIPGAIALSADNINDGLLTADELFNLENQLQAQLVVLSACDTGRGAITGDGIIGLSRSLIAAGTPSILVSLWKVDDASTGELMVRFYEHLEESGNKAQALRQAMLETMEERPFPRDWAAFTLIGEAF